MEIQHSSSRFLNTVTTKQLENKSHNNYREYTIEIILKLLIEKKIQ